MEFGTIEREIRIDAAPEVVYQVVSTPEHLREWWPDEVQRDDGSESRLRITFGDRASPDAKSETLTVTEADPPRRFAFRWIHDATESTGSPPSLLVTFDLVPDGSGTVLRFSETGFREKGWEAAVLERAFHEHETGWDHFLPRLIEYVDRLAAVT